MHLGPARGPSLLRIKMASDTQQDLRERCYYLLNLFKVKDMSLFEKYTKDLATTSAADSVVFYQFLLAEYKKLVEGAPVASPVAKPATVTKKKVAKKPVTKKKATPKKSSKKAVKKRR